MLVLAKHQYASAHGYTHILSLLKLPPISLPSQLSRFVTGPWFEFPESYSKFPLAIYFAYSNVSFHVTLSILCIFRATFVFNVHYKIVQQNQEDKWSLILTGKRMWCFAPNVLNNVFWETVMQTTTKKNVHADLDKNLII